MSKKRKTPIEINNADIYKFISLNSSLKVEQVKECFVTYAKLIDTFIESETVGQDVSFLLPKIGRFYFRLQKRRKKGSKYIIPNLKTGQLISCEITDDVCDYTRLDFMVYESIQRKLKDFAYSKNSSKKLVEGLMKNKENKKKELEEDDEFWETEE